MQERASVALDLPLLEHEVPGKGLSKRCQFQRAQILAQKHSKPYPGHVMVSALPLYILRTENNKT